MALRGESKHQYNKEYWQLYYKRNRKRLLNYRKLRREKDRENWRNWYKRKKIKEMEKRRKEKIRMGQVYTPKKIYSPS